MMDNLTADWIHKFDQATGAFHVIAETLAAFRDALIDKDFSPEAAEQISDTMLVWVLTHNE